MRAQEPRDAVPLGHKRMRCGRGLYLIEAFSDEEVAWHNAKALEDCTDAGSLCADYECAVAVYSKCSGEQVREQVSATGLGNMQPSQDCCNPVAERLLLRVGPCGVL